MQVILQEVIDNYQAEIISPLRSDTLEDMNTNIATALEWVQDWRRKHDN